MRLDYEISCRECKKVLDLEDYFHNDGCIVYYLRCPKCRGHYTVIKPENEPDS